MLVRFYSRSMGLYISALPNDFDGIAELSFIDRDGNATRLLDAVGDREKWTLLPRQGCSMEPLLIDGNGYRFVQSDRAVIQDGFACRAATAAGQVFFVVFSDTDEAAAPRQISLPLNKKLVIGSSGDCDIITDFAVVNNYHAIIEHNACGVTVKPVDGSEVFVNREYVESEEGRALNPGDTVDIYGLRAVNMGDFLGVYGYAGTCSFGKKAQEYLPRIYEMPGSAGEADADEDEIFNRSPRIYMKQETAKFTLDSPPGSEKSEEMPLALSMGSSAMMGMSSILMATMSLQSALQTGKGFMSVLPSVLMSLGMFTGSMVMPVITRRYTEKQKDKKERLRSEKYLKYLAEKNSEIENRAEYQRKMLEETYPDLPRLKESLYTRSGSLWERMLGHGDFLDVRLGLASIDSDIEMNDPGEHFNVNDDALRDAYLDFMHKKRVIENAPLMLPLRKTQLLGIYGPHGKRDEYVRSLLTQICIQHSYKELKVFVIYPETAEDEWEYTRWIPHCWNDEKSERYIGSSAEDMMKLSSALQRLCFSERVTRKEEETIHCLVIAADLKLAEKCRSLMSALKRPEGYPFSMIALAEKAGDLPKECKSVVALGENRGRLFRDISQLEKTEDFAFDDMQIASDIRSIALKLRHTKLAGEEADGLLPDMITFFEMLRVGNVNALNAPLRWKNSNPVKSLAAPLGVDKDGGLLYLDVHQDAHGPHGLVAGTTGSGKSELLITYLISMAVYYDPMEVGFILIDYKGGGMSDTLKLLPHVVGVIDNLGGKQGIHRSMVSITNELKRRQRIFKETGEKLGLRNIDIHKYQKLYRSGDVTEPLQHLIIVSDEFAELKQQEPDFMDDLVSAARIGRSLGIHLILATQKPAGVVNDQILSNTRFRICMKVQDRADSMSMISKPDAAMLTKTGRYYLQVGMDEVFQLGQNAWSGADATNDEFFVQKPDLSIEILDNHAFPIAKAVPQAYANKNEGGAKAAKQVDAIVKYIHEEALKAGKTPKQVWLPMLRTDISIAELEAKYAVKYEKRRLDPVVGEIDDPSAQSQYPLRVDICRGNVIALGMAGSGTEEFANNLIWSICMNVSPEDVNIYSVDFASETTRAFQAMPQVGDVMGNGDDEKISNLFSWLDKESARRRVLLSTYGGNLEMLRKRSGEHIPDIVVVIQNFAAFSESYDELEDTLYRLTRDASSFGIYFAVTANNTRAVRSKMMQNFKQIYCFQMTEEMEYQNLLGKTEGIAPSKRRGSGICEGDGRVVEFQTALLFDSESGAGEDTNIAERIAKASRLKADEWKGIKASRVKILPETVSLNDLADDAENIALSEVPVAIHKSKLDTVTWDIGSDCINLLLYKDKTGMMFVECLAQMLSAKKNRRVCVLDTGDVIDKRFAAGFEVARSDAEICTLAANLRDTVKSRIDIKKAAQGEDTKFDELMIILGSIKRLTEIIDSVGEQYNIKNGFDTMLKYGTPSIGVTIIIATKPEELSGLALRKWYDRINRSSGIWLGEGITSQQFLNASNVRINDTVPEGAYGYVVRNEKAAACKFLQSMDT